MAAPLSGSPSTPTAPSNALPVSAPIEASRWRSTYGQLPANFYTRLAPKPLPSPALGAYSQNLAQQLSLPPDAPTDWLQVLSGNQVAAGSDPLATVYAGHQFGVYVPQLGDGRALLLGAVQATDGSWWELQLKGAGKTPYSRMGDGRAVLRSSIREFLCSEAMHGLGIPTTRALALVSSPQPVLRETVETAAVVTRAAPSFVRFGHFEFFFWRQQFAELKVLADYVIDNFMPQCRQAGDGAATYLAFIREVTRRTAQLIAQWQGVAFCHGVMNTDNMSVLGLTIDYGPFGFIDGFDANHVCNHSDHQGRYAYNNQPAVAHWNLYCLGQALIPLTEDAEATQAALDSFTSEYQTAYEHVFAAKLGLKQWAPEDQPLLDELLQLLNNARTDWTIFWRRLSSLQLDNPANDSALRDMFVERQHFDVWAERYRVRLRAEQSDDATRSPQMNRHNPKYILRNYLAEVAIAQARGDQGEPQFDELARLVECLRHPYDEQPQFESYAKLPPDWAANLHLSCSS